MKNDPETRPKELCARSVTPAPAAPRLSHVAAGAFRVAAAWCAFTLGAAAGSADSADGRLLFETAALLEARGIGVSLRGFDTEGRIHLNATQEPESEMLLPPELLVNSDPDQPVVNAWIYISGPEHIKVLEEGMVDPFWKGVEFELLSPCLPEVYLLRSDAPLSGQQLRDLSGSGITDAPPQLLPDAPLTYVPERTDLPGCGFGWSLVHTYYCPGQPSGPRTGPLVAVLDTGVDMGHPHMLGENGGAHTVTPSPPEGDDGYHGTSIAGIIAASVLDGTPVAGVCPQARIMSIKIATPGGPLIPSRLIRGMCAAVEGGARIVNVSYANFAERPLLDGLYTRLLDYTHQQGVLVVVAATTHAERTSANHTLPYTYAEEYDNLIVVMGLEAYNRPLPGSSQMAKRYVDLAAPGSMVTTIRAGGRDNDRYKRDTGSSFAAAFVSGTLAALWNADPDASWVEIRDRLLNDVTCTSANLDGYVHDGRALDLDMLCTQLGGFDR